MKTISLLQPWATLVVMGAKKIETRSWNTKHRGPLLIHASAGKDKDGYALWHSIHCWDKFTYNRHFAELPFGAIIGQVELITTFPTELTASPNAEGIFFNEHGAKFTTQELAFGNYLPGRYGWLLSNPVNFHNPIEAKGSLSLWEYPLSDFLSHNI